MPTIKRHKLWYILEGIRLWNGYKGDGENDSISLEIPAWKDINGNTYTNIYAGRFYRPPSEKLKKRHRFNNNSHFSDIITPEAYGGQRSIYGDIHDFIMSRGNTGVTSDWTTYFGERQRFLFDSEFLARTNYPGVSDSIDYSVGSFFYKKNIDNIFVPHTPGVERTYLYLPKKNVNGQTYIDNTYTDAYGFDEYVGPITALADGEDFSETYTNYYRALKKEDLIVKNILYMDKIKSWGYPYVYKGLLNNYTSLDSFINIYASNESLNSWSRDAYAISGLNGSTSIETNFIISNSGVGSRQYEVTITNDSLASITVNCLKFTKKVYMHDKTVPDYDDINAFNNGAFIETEGLYLSYYLDSSITLAPGEEKTLYISFLVNQDVSPNFKKSRYALGMETTRLANFSSKSDAINLKKITAFTIRSGKHNEGIGPSYSRFHNYGYITCYQGTEGLPCIWKDINGNSSDNHNNNYDTIFGGIYNCSRYIYGFLKFDAPTANDMIYNFVPENFNDNSASWQSDNFPGIGHVILHTEENEKNSFINNIISPNIEDVYSKDFLLNDEIYEYEIDNAASFDKNLIPVPTTDLIEDWSVDDYGIENKFNTYTYETHFNKSSGEFLRTYTLKVINDSSELKMFSCIKFIKSVPYKISNTTWAAIEDQAINRRESSSITELSYNAEPPYEAFPYYTEVLYGSYFFSTPIPIPPGEFRTVTLTVTPEDISIDVIIDDDDDEEEEGEG